ncbi:autotransporter assembly complex protein TamA [Rhizobacter sp. LjRoot28]|uniref:autotransporter assembly complex protein TamA n=1 Tax=Rhizobacter sp. LjRoot28 TaxID=3342309 RepID=UPI003ECD610D
MSSASPSRLRGAMAAALLCVLLVGCATRDDDRKEGSPPPPTPVKLQVEAPRPLDELLSTHLDVARLGVIAPDAALDETELARLVAATPAQARELLKTEGYFNPTIQVERVPGERPVVRVRVEPGARVHVGEVSIRAEGPLAESAARGDAHAATATQALRENWPLPPGAPFRNPLWSGGKRDALAQLRAQGYLAAEWQETAARIDGERQRAELSLVADSGPLYRTGSLRIRGLQAHDEETIRNVADFDPGTIATESLLLDFQERLQNTNLFDRATVIVQPDAADPGAAVVDVRVRERKLQEATFGIGVSADVGVRGTVEHVHRRPFGWAAIARNNFELSQLRNSWQGELSTHTLPGLWRNLVGGAAERIESDTDTVVSGRARIGRAQDTRAIDRLVFLEFERSLTRGPAGREQANALGLHYHGIWRDVDDPLLPTRGHVWVGQVGAGVAESEPGARGPFSRLYGRYRGYWPLGNRWFSQARIELGQVFSRDDVSVPESMRFRAGGDNSVRGYAFRSLTPQVNGVDTGGRVVFTSSVEVARPLLARMPELWGAAFVDAGRAAERFSDLDPAVGAGVGLRYRSPIGPVSLDVAYGEEVRKFRLHLNVGVTF